MPTRLIRVSLELDPETWDRIQRRARDQGRLPRDWISDRIAEQLEPWRAWTRDLGVVLVAGAVLLGAWTGIAAEWFEAWPRFR